VTGVPAPPGWSRWLIGDVFDRLADIPDGSVHSVITSPPYWRKRRYLPPDHPDAAREIGQEPSPGEFIATLLRLTDELWRVVRDDGTIWINLGDTSAVSGGAGGDYGPGGKREGQPKYGGSATAGGGLAPNGKRRGGTPISIGTPRGKSVCWIPQLFGASLAYGRNLLTGDPCQQWITRPPVTWCKPTTTPEPATDRFLIATELIVWAAKQPSYYWDRAAILEPHADSPGNRYKRHVTPVDRAKRDQGDKTANAITADYQATDGVPPRDWWVINTGNYPHAHFATFPPELIIRPVLASCPPGGTILDPFGGSGTTAAVATGHGRNCIAIDLDPRNADLARQRVGMFLDVDQPEPELDPQRSFDDALQEAAHG
jgi:DNA modification methylase